MASSRKRRRALSPSSPRKCQTRALSSTSEEDVQSTIAVSLPLDPAESLPSDHDESLPLDHAEALESDWEDVRDDAALRWPRLFARFTMAINDYPRQHMCPSWQLRLATLKARTSYVQAIMEYIPKVVASMLNREKPPTLEELCSIPWFETRDPGVYGHLLVPNAQTIGLAGENHARLYIGSSARSVHDSEGSLRVRRKEHERDFKRMYV